MNKLLLKPEFLIENTAGGLTLQSTMRVGNRTDVTDIFMLSKLHAILFSCCSGRYTMPQIEDFLCTTLHISKEEAGAVFRKFYHPFQIFIEETEDATRDDLRLDQLLAGPKTPRFPEASTIPERKLELLVVYVTNSCSSNCIYCSVDAGREVHEIPQLNVNDYQAIAKQAYEMQVESVQMTGGDPLVRKDIADIVAAFTQYGLKVDISTKEVVSRTTLQRLYDAGLTSFQFSLDSCDAYIYSQLTGNPPQKLERLLQSMQDAAQVGLKLVSKGVLTRLNQYGMGELFETLHDIGCSMVQFQQLFNGQGRPDPNLYLSASEYHALYKQIVSLADQYPDMDVYPGYFPYELEYGSNLYSKRSQCGAGSTGMTIHANGKYGYCGMSTYDVFQFSDVHEMSLSEAWNSSTIQALKAPERSQFDNTLCHDCEYFVQCAPHRCLVRTYVQTGKLFEADPLCPLKERQHAG